MKLYQIVLKDIMRRKRQMLYSALGVAIGTMTVVGILTIAVAGEAKIYNQVDKYGANLTVIPAINQLDMKLGDLSLGILAVGDNYIPDEKVIRVGQITDDKIKESLCVVGPAAVVSPKLYINTNVGAVSVTVVGINPQEEGKIKTWWRVQEGEYINGTDQALVGSIAAQLLKLSVGETITLNKADVTVAGILVETGSNDDYQIFVPIGTLQKAFDKEAIVSSVDIRAPCNACPVEFIADAINQGVPGVRAIAVKQIADSEMGMVERMKKFMLALAGITLAVGCFGVTNTMMTSVHRRIKDIGIMRAVGASRNQILKVFIYEAIIIGVVGGIFGYVIGTLLAYIIGPIIFAGVNVVYLPQYLPLSLALAIFIAVLATVYPSYLAAKIKVADSFRSL